MKNKKTKVKRVKRRRLKGIYISHDLGLTILGFGLGYMAGKAAKK